MFEKLMNDFTDMAGEITEGSICGAMGAGAGAVSGVALSASGFGLTTLPAVGAGMTIGLTDLPHPF
jgi:hypothetical protein